MAKRTEKLNALIFIDTNILLDFYRIRKSDISLKYLETIEAHRNILILNNQVEMEFKKNRQIVILEALGEINKIPSGNLNVPTIFVEAKPIEMIQKAQKEISSQQKKIRARIDKLLTNPGTQDKVFQTLQRVFKTESEFNLNRENKKRYTIRKLALKRFALGYPPRKKGDNSIGDAINWEWIIDCASRTDKHIIIVTRDSDYGLTHNDNSFLNDWLQIEFKDRISHRRKLILTDKLSTAFKLVKIPVTQAMIEEEENVINFTSLKYSIRAMQEALKRSQENFNLSGLQESMRQFQDTNKMDVFRKAFQSNIIKKDLKKEADNSDI